MRSRPLVGISTSEMRVATSVTQTPQGEPPRRELALGLLYPRAIERAGALPVVLAPVGEEALESLLDRLAGLCLSGGPDLHPESYGGDHHPSLGPTEPELDRFELALARGAMARGLPLLGICRGAQVLNIARGGSLHPHLPDLAGAQLDHHRHPERGQVAHHGVRIEAGSRLRDVYRRPRLEVNSFHHQAADRLGRGLVATAHGADGVIEALEDPSADFCVGVQWHAECLVDRDVHPSLFSALADAARRYETAWQGRRAA